MPQELPLPGPGALVHVRGDRWRVLDVARHEDCGLCRLAGVRPSNRGVQLTLILPFDRAVPVARPEVRARSGRRRWFGALRWHLLQAIGPGGLRAGLDGRFDLLPYQLEPALAVLCGETRILIADEVGLGKTVQAALIVAELVARGHAARCLVLAPAGLCGQWVAELQGRFGLPATHVDAFLLRSLASLSPPELTPWEQLSLAVSSFDYVKQPEVLVGLRELRWDVLIVDEAHMVALAPGRAAAVRLLSSRARRVVLLTATPHAADTEGFRALCETGRLAGEDPIVLFRRTREALGIRRLRRVALLRVGLSAAERRMHDALDRYTAAVWRESESRGASEDARLAMVVLRKRAASGPAALHASLSRRLQWLAPRAEPTGWQLSLPLDDASDVDAADEEPGAVLRAPGLRNVEAERRRLLHLIDLSRAAGGADSKARALERLLARSGEPAIVFTEYRDTLVHLAGRLRARVTVALLHGGLDQAGRREAVRAFTRGDARVLLATDAAAHGLNLHARCRLVVDMELPWTPARLEQRIGRVDRIGQQRRVHAVHLVGRRTSEEQVLARLVLRLARETAALGRADNPLGAAGELEVARVVFGRTPGAAEASPGTQLQGAAPAPSGTLTATTAVATSSELLQSGGICRQLALEAIARAEAARLEQARRLAAPPGRQRAAVVQGETLRPCWAVVRRRRGAASLPAGLLCVFVSRIVDDRGSLVEESLSVLHVDIAAAVRRRKTLEAELPRLLAACRPELDRHAARLAAERLDEQRRSAASRLAPLTAREEALSMACRQETFALQPGLFDRRAIKQADEDRRRRERDDQDTAARLQGLARQARLELAADPELVLVLGVAI